MSNRQQRGFKKRPYQKKDNDRSVEDIVRDLRHTGEPSSDYREQSLKIHGLICAKCGREFEYKDRQLLTVHHKDGNHNNNPADGSNWENLCVYCHEDEHSRVLLGDYLSRKDR
ncbi:MAG TPA: YajD family HNH nuclease [Thermodesulfovibrionales bacterium]|nr:YajD family HNH nuclease [Thermodesulfovibrionales bacterium]